MSIGAQLHLEISMNVSIRELIYLMAGAVLAGGSGDLLPKSREALPNRNDEYSHHDIGLSAVGEVRILPFPPESEL